MPASPRQKRSEVSSRKVMRAALHLFSKQGFRATSMRQIASRAGLSMGNVYHHCGSKERLFQRLIDQYWERLLDPDLPLNRLFARGRFPDDLEKLAGEIEAVVAANRPFILLIYIDVIEFRGRHIRNFYLGMADRFREAFGDRFESLRAEGRFGDVDPMVAVMIAVRWLFYYFTVEQCFGVKNHLGVDSRKAVAEFVRLMRLGVLPRGETGGSIPSPAAAGKPPGRSR